jgi:hypothetical protein
MAMLNLEAGAGALTSVEAPIKQLLAAEQNRDAAMVCCKLSFPRAHPCFMAMAVL